MLEPMRVKGTEGPRSVALFDRRPAEAPALAPHLGADETSIHKEIGYSAAKIDALLARRILVSQPNRAPGPFRQVNTARNDRDEMEHSHKLMIEKNGGLVYLLLADRYGIFNYKFFFRINHD